MANKKENSAEVLSKLTQEEQLLRERKQSEQSKSMTIISRLVLFFLFPTFVGSCGLISSYMQNKYGKDPEPMDFDRDFVYPFLVTIVLVVVVSIQTGNFSSYQATPIVSWPKVVKKKKIIHKTVLLDDDGNVITEDEDVVKELINQDENEGDKKSASAKKKD